MVVLQLLGISYSCYNNNFITKLWDPGLTISIYTCFSWNSFLEIVQWSLCYSKLIWKFQTHLVKSSTQSSRVIQSTLSLRLFYILSKFKNWSSYNYAQCGYGSDNKCVPFLGVVSDEENFDNDRDIPDSMVGECRVVNGTTYEAGKLLLLVNSQIFKLIFFEISNKLQKQVYNANNMNSL